VCSGALGVTAKGGVKPIVGGVDGGTRGGLVEVGGVAVIGADG